MWTEGIILIVLGKGGHVELGVELYHRVLFAIHEDACFRCGRNLEVCISGFSKGS